MMSQSPIPATYLESFIDADPGRDDDIAGMDSIVTGYKRALLIWPTLRIAFMISGLGTVRKWPKENKIWFVNRLTPNDPYMVRTAPLTPKLCILYTYSTNVGTEYFKHALYSSFFFLFKMQFVS